MAAYGLLQEPKLVSAPYDFDGVLLLCRSFNDTAIQVASALEGCLRGEVIRRLLHQRVPNGLESNALSLGFF